MKLSPCIHQFFHPYLKNLRGMSPNTIRSYRDTFKIFLPFAAKYYGIKIRSLRLEHISSSSISGNTVKPQGPSINTASSSANEENNSPATASITSVKNISSEPFHQND
jgi:hypothetical protein